MADPQFMADIALARTLVSLKDHRRKLLLARLDPERAALMRDVLAGNDGKDGRADSIRKVAGLTRLH